MRITRIIAIPLVVVWVVLGACASVRQTPVSLMPTPTPKSAVFITSNLTIEPPATWPGNSSMIGVTVTNTGEQPGTYTVVLKLNGVIARTQDVTLAGRASQNVTFLFSTYSERDYVVTIDQLNGLLQVRVGL